MTWEEAREQGWAFRLGEDGSTYVAFRGDHSVFGSSSEDLLSSLSAVMRRGAGPSVRAGSHQLRRQFLPSEQGA
jgi:hypothetical protein